MVEMELDCLRGFRASDRRSLYGSAFLAQPGKFVTNFLDCHLQIASSGGGLLRSRAQFLKNFQLNDSSMSAGIFVWSRA
jgi:hypothetical protein